MRKVSSAFLPQRAEYCLKNTKMFLPGNKGFFPSRPQLRRWSCPDQTTSSSSPPAPASTGRGPGRHPTPSPAPRLCAGPGVPPELEEFENRTRERWKNSEKKIAHHLFSFIDFGNICTCGVWGGKPRSWRGSTVPAETPRSIFKGEFFPNPATAGE